MPDALNFGWDNKQMPLQRLHCSISFFSLISIGRCERDARGTIPRYNCTCGVLVQTKQVRSQGGLCGNIQ